MPFQDGLDDHFHATPVEAEGLRLVAEGRTDEQVAEILGKPVRAVRATLHRFHERTGLVGRRAMAWSGKHLDCCLKVNSA
jgi:DNA-binding CsgD family transcriptional regulator